MSAHRKPDNELIGQTFGLMTVLRFDRREKRRRWWICQCQCGTIKPACHTDLINGATKSCGCQRPTQLAAGRAALTVHGHSGLIQSPTYRTWHKMKQRCLNPQSSHFHLYGGKGVVICARWLAFENFLSDMGERPVGESIDRIDSNGNYEPGNCRWATPREQGNNTNRNVFLEHEGERLTVAEWARKWGLPPHVVHSRVVKMGWSMERAKRESVKPRTERTNETATS